MAEETDEERILSLFIPDALVQNPGIVWAVLDQVVGLNVRVKAHMMWHQTIQNSELHPTERTVRFAQIQALLDYADEVDPKNKEITDWCLVHFGWKFPLNPTEKDAE